MVGYSYDKENKQRDYTYMARERGQEILFVGMSQFINRGMNQKVTGRIICFMTAIVQVVSVVVL